MNSFFNHSNGIKVFSCTEPPCGKSDSQWGELGTRQIIFFPVASEKNGTHNIRFERWLDSVCGNSINNVPFLKQSRDCINYWRLLNLTRSYFYWIADLRQMFDFASTSPLHRDSLRRVEISDSVGLHPGQSTDRGHPAGRRRFHCTQTTPSCASAHRVTVLEESPREISLNYSCQTKSLFI